jgi:tripartite ATP-independent transporter DctP family solute receptor
MKKKILAWGLAAMMALSMTACGSGSADPTTAPASAGPAGTAAAGTAAAGGDVQFTLKLSVSAPATGTQADGYAKLAELVKERTGGAVEVQVYPGSQLADKVPSMEGLRDGSIEMTVAALTDIATFGDVWGTFSLPYLFEDTDQLIQVLNSDDVGAFVEEKLAAIGMIPLMYMDIGSRSILNSKHAVNTPADMAGLKIRVMQDSTLAAAINAMGGIATPMAWSETYTALQQGTVDGLENSAPIITANMMNEVAKYYSLTEQFIIADCLLISKNTFDGMPSDLQAQVKEACKEAEKYWNTELWPAAMETELQAMKDSGVEINDVDKAAFKESVTGMKEEWLANASDDCKQLYDLLSAATAK